MNRHGALVTSLNQLTAFKFQTIRFNQKMSRGRQMGRRRDKEPFPNANDFRVNNQICTDFHSELKQNIPMMISKNLS